MVYTEGSSFNFLDFDDLHIRQLVKQCPNLEELPSSSRSNSFKYVQELNSIPKLKKISILRDDYQLATDQFWQFIELCPNLERLQFTSNVFEKFLLWSDTFGKVPSIKSISIIDHIKFWGRDLMTVVQTFKDVFTSIIRFNVTVDEFNKLLECPQIDGFKVSDFIFPIFPIADFLECPQASKIVSIDIRRNFFDVNLKNGHKLTHSIEKLRLLRSKFCSDSMMKQLTNYVVFSNLKKVDLFVRYDSIILELFIRLVQTRGDIFSKLEMEPEDNSIIYEDFNELIDTILEHCQNMKLLKLYLSVNTSSDTVFDEPFYRKLYSIRVRQSVYFKIKFDYASSDKYWTSIDVLECIEKQSNKTVTLEMGSYLFHSWKTVQNNIQHSYL